MFKYVSAVLLLIGAALAQEEECKETDERCAIWARGGYCNSEKYQTYMSKYCKESCGICLQRCLSLPSCEDKMRLFCTAPTSGEIELVCCSPCRRLQSVIEDASAGRCGIVSSTCTQQPTEDFDAAEGSIPWQVYVPIGPKENVFCGGVLISARHVLTAAHCLYNKPHLTTRRHPSDNNDDTKSSFVDDDYFHVYLGKHHRNRTDDAELRVGVKKMVSHFMYNYVTNDFDIALLTLEEEVQFTSHIRPICLKPTHDVTMDGTARVSGWSNKEDNNGASDILQVIDINLVDHDECISLLRNYTTDRVTDNMICAGNLEGGTDACEGDSGGPLSVDINNQHFLVGLVSWGYGCGRVNTPGGYTKISAFLDWIFENQTL